MKKSEMKRNILVFFVCMIVMIFVSGFGSLFTSGETNSGWYNTVKPSITPPSYVFPIVWTILFFLIGLSLFFSWINAKNDNVKKRIFIVFGINFALNIFWSLFYFGMHNPILAFIDIILLIMSIVFMIRASYRVSKIAGWLLVPYLLWVCFASILNFMSI